MSHGAVRHPDLLGVFVVLGFFVYLSDQHTLPAWEFDAAHAVTLVTLIVCGPLAALIVAVFPEPFRFFIGRNTRAPRPIAVVANTASFAWQAVAAYAVLRAVPLGHGAVEAWPAYALAGASLVVVNVTVVWGLLQHMVDGKAMRPAVRIIASMLPIAMVSAVIAATYTVIGLPALAAFAAIACLPGVLVRFATPILAPRAAGLNLSEATRRYADAISDTMQLSGSRRRAIRLATGCDAPMYRALTGERLFRDRYNALQLQFELDLVTRHGDAPWAALDTRVLEVSKAWASLTAAGTAQLSHTAALTRLENEMSEQAAPVLRAAWQVVNDQPVQAQQHALAPSTRVLARRITALGAVVAMG